MIYLCNKILVDFVTSVEVKGIVVINYVNFLIHRILV